MASTAAQLSALGKDPQFIGRMVSLIIQMAEQKYASVTDNTSPLRILAKQIIQSNDVAARYVGAMVNRPNFIAATTSFDFVSGNVVTDATDAAILSQLDTDWAMLAGV